MSELEKWDVPDSITLSEFLYMLSLVILDTMTLRARPRKPDLDSRLL